MWHEHDLDINGFNYHYYRRARDGAEKIVLAHGFSDNGLCWQRTADHLANRFDVTLIDARNHGQSGRAASDADRMVEDLAALIRELAPGESVYLLGHSMGASTVGGVAAKYPKLVKAALLEDPPWMAKQTPGSVEEQETEKAKREKGFKKFLSSLKSKTIDELVKFARSIYPDWHEDDLPAWAESKLQVSEDAYLGLAFNTWHEDARAISVPTLLIYTDGARDGLLLAEVVEDLLATNPHLKGAEIKGAGHNIRRENFPDFISAVDGFLGTV